MNGTNSEKRDIKKGETQRTNNGFDMLNAHSFLGISFVANAIKTETVGQRK